MNLPAYEVDTVEVDGATGSHSMLAVTCPRKGCRGEFWVMRKWAYLAEVVGSSGQATIIYGRSCPYCCKTAAIPEEYARKRPRVKRSRARAGA